MIKTLCSALLVASAVALAACGDDEQPTTSQRTLTFTEQPTEYFSFSDTAPKTEMGPEGPKRLSSGDQLTFSSDLLDKAGQDAGDLEVVCVVTRPGGFPESHAHCSATATIPGGTLTLSRGGNVFGDAQPRGSIVGGTGKFADVTGAFSEAEESEERTVYTFAITAGRS